MKDYYKKVNWLRVLLSTVTAVALALIFVFVSGENFYSGLKELIQNVIPDLVAVLIAIPIIYFLFTIRGLSPQEEFKQEIIDGISKLNPLQSGFKEGAEVDRIYNIEEKLKKVQTLDLIGLSCVNFLARFRIEIADALKNKVKFRIIVVEPNSKSSQVLMHNHEELERDLERSKKRIEQILQDVDAKEFGSIEIRMIDWIPSCSLVIADKNKSNAEIRVKVYPLVIDTPSASIKTHNIIYRKHEPEVAKYFIQHFDMLWEKSKVFYFEGMS